jgi:NAD+ synthase
MTESRSLRIALAQLNQSMGDLRANAAAMLDWRAKAAAQHADLIVFPELQLIGYPPEDLVLKPALVERAELELIRLAEATGDGGPAMLVGTALEAGGLLFDCVALLDEGTIVAVSQKRELPN